MEVPQELLLVLANTQAVDHSVRAHAEEQLIFLQKNELRTLTPDRP
jgi:hypothetical protein